MRTKPFARFVRPVGRILFLTDPDPSDYRHLTNLDDATSQSARTAGYLFKALQKSGAEIHPTSNPGDILTLRNRIDFVFSARADFTCPSVDVPVAALCDLAGIPCLNGNTIAIATARDKSLGKLSALHCGVETPDWVVIHPSSDLAMLETLAYPRYAKSLVGNNSDPTAGEGLVRSVEEAVAVARKWQRTGQPAIFETFVPGADLIVGVIGNGAKGYAIGKIIRVDTDHPENIQTYDHKFLGRGKRHRTVVPDESINRQVHAAIQNLHDQVGPLDCYRANFRWNESNGSLHFLEISPTVTIEPESIFIQSVARHPNDHTTVILDILEAGLRRHALRLPATTANTADDSKRLPHAPSAQGAPPVGTILFLAQFAPSSRNAPPEPDHAEWGDLAHFHHHLYQTLLGLGLDVIPSRDPEDILNLRQQVDYVFSVFEGQAFPSTGTVIPALCEAADLPFLGAAANSLGPDIDKQLGKLLAERLGMKTPTWCRYGPLDPLNDLASLRYPCIVKWQNGGNSKYLGDDAIVWNADQAAKRISVFQSMGLPCLVEQFIPGTNLTTGAVQFPEGLHVGRTIRIDTDAPGNIQTYDRKLLGHGERRKTVFDGPEIVERIDAFMRQLHSEIHQSDFFRVDFRFDAENDALYFLEINLQCNLDPFGTFVLSTVGGPERYSELIAKMLDVSLQKHGMARPYRVPMPD